MSEGEFMVFRLGNSFFVEPVGKPDGVLVASEIGVLLAHT